MSPLGGITLFVNILILVVGSLLRVLARRGLSLLPLWSFFYRLVGHEGDSWSRRLLSWSVATGIFFLVSGGTVGVLAAVLEQGTNMKLISETFEYQRAWAEEENERNISARRNELATPVTSADFSAPFFPIASSTDKEAATGTIVRASNEQ